MGVSKLSFITQQLMSYGYSESTPVAVIRWGSMPDQQTVFGTVSTIVELVRQAQLNPPAVIVMGKVVQMAHQLQWFDPANAFLLAAEALLWQKILVLLCPLLKVRSMS
jgi:siroheme synthase